MEARFPRLIDAILSLGPTHAARASVLGVSERSVIAYVRDGVVPGAVIIARTEVTLEAFCADARARLNNNAPGNTSEA